MTTAIPAKRRLLGWYFFDWASQPYNTLLLTFVFGPYFTEIAVAHYMATGLDKDLAGAAAQTYWGWGQTFSGLAIAVLAPILGAVADGTGRRMPWIWLFSLLYVAGAWWIWYLVPGEPSLMFMALLAFSIGLIGMEFATIFTNSLMPDLASDDDMGKVSGSGFAFGYLGGIIALIFMLLLLAENGATGKTLIGVPPLFGLDPAMREGTRAVGPFTALWYIVFMIPFFLWVREPKDRARPGVLQSLRALWVLIKSLGERQSLGAHLLSSMLYRDSLNALYAFGGIYAKGVLGWSITSIGVFGIIAAISAAFFAWLGGKYDSAKGPKPLMKLSIWVLLGTCLVIAGMSREAFFGVPFAADSSLPDYIFYACGILIGAAGATLQSASRTMMVFHTTPERSTEAFGLYALSGKATAFIAPFAITIFTAVSGSQRLGIAVPLIVLFIIGMILLRWVKPRGERT